MIASTQIADARAMKKIFQKSEPPVVMDRHEPRKRPAIKRQYREKSLSTGKHCALKAATTKDLVDDYDDCWYWMAFYLLD